jgi:D-alanyl-D-alanine carboxypeptidase/D-alanyl-D-alanine-endopeptidase (penicillin-binding protein 4)
MIPISQSPKPTRFNLARVDFLQAVALCSLLLTWVLSPIGRCANPIAAEFEAITSTIGEHDALLIADSQGKILVSKNVDRELIPASILKIFTALVGLHYLGEGFRYSTEFFLDRDSNLKIKGFGDPLLISEVIQEICQHLAPLIDPTDGVKDLILDDSHFAQPLTIPGVNSSSEPYDAPNGALCVNFNTVYFKHTRDGFVSAEPQTPLLPFAEKKISASNSSSGRIVLSHIGNENSIYAGKLFQYYLQQQGIPFWGTVKLGRVDPGRDRLLYRYVSLFSLVQIISKLLEHSNNFIANQLLITAGIKTFGPPGHLEKGVAAAREYAGKVLHIGKMNIIEGSGISRENRLSARQMHRILDEFEPYHKLMRQEGREFYKTGTLYGINNRAGYISDPMGGLYRYVIMINTPGKSIHPTVRKMFKILD